MADTIMRVSDRIAVLAMAVSLSFVDFGARAQCTMARVAVLPVTIAHGHPLVTATLNGGEAKLIFDTGAFNSLLSEAAVDRLQLPHMQGEEIRNTLAVVGGIGGARTAHLVTARIVELGGLRGRNYNFVASDFGMNWSDGLLSIDLVSQFDIDLDFPESKIVLYRPTGDCHEPAAFLGGPLFSARLEPNGEDRRPRVRVDVAGTRLVALIDTGAPVSLVTRSAADRLGLRPAPPGARADSLGGIGPRRLVATHATLSDVAVGDLAFERLPVSVADGPFDGSVQMILGADFQSLVHVWVSYSSHTLIMQYPARASKSMSSP